MPTVLQLDYRPRRADIFGYRGDDLIAKYQFRDGAGAPIDITTWSFDAQVRTSKDDATIVQTLTCDKVDAANGRLDVSLASALSASMQGNYVWDLQRTLDGLIRTLMGGKFSIDGDVTRAP